LKAGGAIKVNPDKTVTWVRTGPLVETPVSCMFNLYASGQITNLKILKSSGSDAVDQAALALIRKAAPFRFDPKEQGQQNVHFTNSDVIVVRAEEDDQLPE
jgi:TonB family protein